MKRKALPRILTGALAAVTLFASVSAFAADKESFNSFYSGTLKSSDKVYMVITSDDAEMHRVIYKVGDKNKFLTISNVTSFTFKSNEFLARYDHNGEFTDHDGNFLDYSEDEVFIETRDVTPKFNFLGILTGVKIVYNTMTYSS